jgi:hypothetical protein
MYFSSSNVSLKGKTFGCRLSTFDFFCKTQNLDCGSRNGGEGKGKGVEHFLSRIEKRI